MHGKRRACVFHRESRFSDHSQQAPECYWLESVPEHRHHATVHQSAEVFCGWIGRKYEWLNNYAIRLFPALGDSRLRLKNPRSGRSGYCNCQVNLAGLSSSNLLSARSRRGKPWRTGTLRPEPYDERFYGSVLPSIRCNLTPIA